MNKIATLLLSCLGLAGCLTVRDSDLAAWVGQPVELLDTQPFFITIPVTKTVTPDGIEIRNYANTRVAANCSGGSTVYGAIPSLATVNTSSSCVQQTMGCNNIFYIKERKVMRYEPVSSGGAICVTDDRVLPKKMI